MKTISFINRKKANQTEIFLPTKLNPGGNLFNLFYFIFFSFPFKEPLSTA